MRTVTVDLGARAYDVTIGSGALVRVGEVVDRRRRAAVVSQPQVAEHWGERVMASLAEAQVDAELFEISAGERAKSMETVEDLARRFAAWGLLRSDVVVALGGGVVGDTAGFAAAVYHRGIALVQAPTTLLAQVDAAVGGKVGVNVPEGKNLIGAFHQPVAVLADIDALASLPERDFKSGVGEVLKYACVLDERLRDMILEDSDALLSRDSDLLEKLVERCVQIKAEVIEGDEHELTGVRARLNYGHTLAHAIETLGGYEMTHGEAVAVGVIFAAELARQLDRIDDDAVTKHRTLVELLELPAVVPADVRRGCRAVDVIEQMRRDKKAAGGLTFVLAGPDGLDRVEDPNEKAVTAALAAVGIAG